MGNSMKENITHKPSKNIKIEQVFVGTWNAVKPESQGKTMLEVYDAIKFPRYAKEEQKVADKLHVFIKEHPELVGWGAIVGEAAFMAGVVAGFRKLKHKKESAVGKTVQVQRVDIRARDAIHQGNFVNLRPEHVHPGTLVLKSDMLHTWEGGKAQIEAGIISHLKRFNEKSWKWDLSFEHVAEMFTTACKAYGSGDDAEMTELAWFAGVIGSFLVAPWVKGQLHDVDDLIAREDWDGALNKLDERFSSYVGRGGLGYNHRIVMNFWANKFRFTGLHVALPGGFDWDHMPANNPKLPNIMQHLQVAHMNRD